MKKHISFLIMNMEKGGGTERVTSVIANKLREKGFIISIISCRNGRKSLYPLEEDISLLSLEGEKISNSTIRKCKNVISLKRIVKEKKIDILIAVDVALYIYILPLQKMKLCKGIAWEHFNCHITPNGLVGISRKLATRYADCVVVLGKRDYNSYLKKYPKIKKIEFIYNPIALNLETSANINVKRVIAVGRLDEQKGFDMLINAWSRIEEKVPDWKLDIFGEGPLRKQLQDQIKNLNLKNIYLKGYSVDIEKEYINSSVFVLSSRYEGFVLALMEAQAKALPCVSFDCKEGPAELIDNGINGYLIEEGNEREFSEKLLELLLDEKMRKKFSENSRKDLDRFNIEKIIEKWNRLIVTL